MRILTLLTKVVLWGAVVGVMGNACFGQSYWKRTFEDVRLNDIVPTTDGNFLLVGYNKSDVWLVKVNSNGDTLWTKTYGGDFKDISTILPTADENFLLVGPHSCIMKINPDGDTLWTKTYEGISIYTIFQTGDGNFLGYTDHLLLKIDTNGDTLWAKTYGGPDEDRISTILPTMEGDFLLVGVKSYDVCLTKINPKGETLWTKTYGKAGIDEFSAMLPTMDGNFLLLVYASINDAGDADQWVLKLNSNGDILWAKTYGEASSFDYFKTITPTMDGNYLLVGRTAPIGTEEYDVWFVKINPNGDIYWTKTYELEEIQGGDDISTIIPTMSGNFLLMGGTSFQMGVGRINANWLLMINQNGDPLWNKTYVVGQFLYTIIDTIVPTTDGNFLFLGNIDYRLYLILYLIDDRYAYRDSLFTFKIPCLGADSLDYGFSPLSTPSGMTVSPGGTISWTPETDSVYMEHVEYVVVNELGRQDTLTFNIYVNCEYGNPMAANRQTHYRRTAATPFEIGTSNLNGRVTFSLPQSATTLSIFDITGRQVGRVAPVNSGDGSHAVWPDPFSGGRSVPAGKYYAKVFMGEGSVVKPFLLVR
ncbi:MAG: hypothetical protein JXA18_16885 [Chitinispirillaceae bacterium]|nr:hypothetical protein [Chitinispirillaceae bacterium]